MGEAVTHGPYIEAKRRDAERAHKRNLKRAIRVFGPKKGKEIVENAEKIGAELIRQENPHIFKTK